MSTLSKSFSHFFSNPVKYSPQADTVAICISTSQEKVIVGVQDFGVGIPQEHQDKIFDRFYRVSDETRRQSPQPTREWTSRHRRREVLNSYYT